MRKQKDKPYGVSEIYFFATNNIDDKIIFKNDTYEVLEEDKDGHLTLVGFTIEPRKTKTFLEFIFNLANEFSNINNNEIIDLSKYKHNCITYEYLQGNYFKWLELSNRENSMDEFGSILEVIEYIKRNKDKIYLFLKINSL